MSIPAILGAAVLQVPDALATDLGISPASLAFGFLAAGVSGVLAIRFFVALLKKRSFYVFAYYCWVVAALYLIFGGR
jgi:undecaprenyl-diphosphatase